LSVSRPKGAGVEAGAEKKLLYFKIILKKNFGGF
jgi:hypothetical protein